MPYGVDLVYTKEDGEGELKEPIYVAHSRAQSVMPFVFAVVHRSAPPSSPIHSLAKVLSFRRSKPFELKASYAQPDVVPGGTRAVGRFRIDGVHPSFDNEAQTVKVKVKFDAHGCFFVDSAQLNDKLPPTPETEQAAAAAAEAGTPAEGAAAATPMDTSDEDKASDATGAAEGVTPMDTSDTPETKAPAAGEVG